MAESLPLSPSAPAEVLPLQWPASDPELHQQVQSNLSPELQQYVRTPEFKAWFGDWEANPAEASRMLDANGEPQLFYSGRPRGIAELDGNHRARTRETGEEHGFYFSKQYGNARGWATMLTNNETGEQMPGSVYTSFLNIRRPDYVTEKGRVMTGKITEIPTHTDGYVNDRMGEVVVFDPNQVLTISEQPVNEYGQPVEITKPPVAA